MAEKGIYFDFDKLNIARDIIASANDSLNGAKSSLITSNANIDSRLNQRYSELVDSKGLYKTLGVDYSLMDKHDFTSIINESIKFSNSVIEVFNLVLPIDYKINRDNLSDINAGIPVAALEPPEIETAREEQVTMAAGSNDQIATTSNPEIETAPASEPETTITIEPEKVPASEPKIALAPEINSEPAPPLEAEKGLVTNGQVMDVPGSLTSRKSYTRYSKVNKRMKENGEYSTPQGAVVYGGTYNGITYDTHTDAETGVRYVNLNGEKYFCVAMGTYFGNVGDTFSVSTDKGNTYKVIMCDVKGNDSQGWHNGKTWYHESNGNKCLTEFYIDHIPEEIKEYRSGKYIGTTGTFDTIKQFSGNVINITKLS